MAQPEDAQTIVFFDGVCHLCNAFVDFTARHDPQRKLFYAALQGETAARLVPAEKREKLDTILVRADGELKEKSDAVAFVFLTLGGPLKALGQAILAVPRPVRNRLYDFVARRRLIWFGERDTCRLPTKEDRAQILP